MRVWMMRCKLPETTSLVFAVMTGIDGDGDGDCESSRYPSAVAQHSGHQPRLQRCSVVTGTVAGAVLTIVKVP
jgi:hypothetical protein